MNHSKLHRAVATAALIAAAAGTTRASCPYNLDPIAPAVESFLANNPQIPGINIRLQRGAVVLYERSFGTYTIDTVVPIASATKWIAGAVIMALVDDGTWTLDDTLGTYLPSFSQGLEAQITIRQAFAHTSGLPANNGTGLDDCNPCLNERFGVTLQQCAGEIGAVGLRTDAQGSKVVPGSEFGYGGCSMQAAGAAAEIAAATPWNLLFSQKVRMPLGMTSMSFGPGTNPRIAGGISSNLRDYARFLEMLVNNGMFNGQQVLSQESVAAMLDEQTNDAPVFYVPPVAEPFVGYGVGNWTNYEGQAQAAGVTLQSSSEGAFGFSPWIDRRRRSLGVFLVQDQNTRVRPLVEFVQTQLRWALDTSPDVSGDGAVNFQDITRVLANFGRPSFLSDPQGPGPVGDCDLSGFVDFGDVTIILSRLGQSCS